MKIDLPDGYYRVLNGVTTNLASIDPPAHGTRLSYLMGQYREHTEHCNACIQGEPCSRRAELETALAAAESERDRQDSQRRGDDSGLQSAKR